MLVVDPDADDSMAAALLDHAVAALCERGAQVIYAGGQYPLNPFYWGLYGGSEFSGILNGHDRFHRAVQAIGFRACSRSVRLELDLGRGGEPSFDPKSLLLRRSYRLTVDPDSMLARWWDALAIGPTFTVGFRLIDSRGAVAAHATTWDMAGFERLDGRLRAGLIDVFVEPDLRRKGLARSLLREVIRHHASRNLHALCVQTNEDNQPALTLYRSFGFAEIGDSILYRLDPPG